MNKKYNNWTKKEWELFKELDEPIKIQNYLDRLEYDSKLESRSPRWVIMENCANCFEGALFAAAALRFIGYRPLIVDLRAINDDDHILAVYQVNKFWGAIGKSNFTTLRYREPVYRTLRELAMSFFDFYFNTLGEKTLREYSVPLDLTRFDKINWMQTDEDLENIGDTLDRIRHYKLITPDIEQKLHKVSASLLEAGLLGSNPSGLYKPNKKIALQK